MFHTSDVVKWEQGIQMFVPSTDYLVEKVRKDNSKSKKGAKVVDRQQPVHESARLKTK